MEANPKKKPKRNCIRFQAELPNETWQSDFTHIWLADGSDTETISWLDDHSRYALHVSVHHRVTGNIVLDTFNKTATTHGFPASVLTDNGQLPAVSNITAIRTPPRSPQANAYAERSVHTLRHELFDHTISWNEQQLRRFVDEYIAHYNTTRPHRGIGQRAPNDTGHVTPIRPDR